MVYLSNLEIRTNIPGIKKKTENVYISAYLRFFKAMFPIPVARAIVSFRKGFKG